jgi:hypothetical protein
MKLENVDSVRGGGTKGSLTPIKVIQSKSNIRKRMFTKELSKDGVAAFEPIVGKNSRLLPNIIRTKNYSESGTQSDIQLLDFNKSMKTIKSCIELK